MRIDFWPSRLHLLLLLICLGLAWAAKRHWNQSPSHTPMKTQRKANIPPRQVVLQPLVKVDPKIKKQALHENQVFQLQSSNEKAQ